MLANEFKVSGQIACLGISTGVWIKTETLIIRMTIDQIRDPPLRKNVFSDESITVPSNMYMILED